MATICSGKPDTRDTKLSVYSGRFALGLNDMLQMIEHFPLLKDWEEGRLDILRDETAVLISRKKTGGKQSHAQQKPAAPVNATVRKAMDKVRQVQVQNGMLVSANETLEEENTRLKRENGNLADKLLNAERDAKLANDMRLLEAARYAKVVAEKDRKIAEQAAQLAAFRLQIGTSKPVKKRQRMVCA